MRISRASIQHLAAAFGLIFLFFTLYAPILSAPFWAVDEWEVLQFSSPTLLHPQMANFRQGMVSLDDYVKYIAQDFTDGSRFRPMWHVIRFAEAALFGHNATAWHVALLVMGSATAILFYAAGRATGMGWLAAFLIPVWMIVAVQAYEIWWRVGPNETSGMVLLALAVFAGVKAANKTHANRWDVLMLVGLVLAGLSKESLALTIPAILFGRVALPVYRGLAGWQDNLRRLWPVLAIGLGTMAVCLAFMTLASRPGTWGASVVSLSLQSFLPWNWLADLGVVAPLMLYFLPVFLAFVIAPNLPNARLSNPWLLASYAAFALWAIPQLILYSSTVLAGRFLYPVLAAPAALNGWATDVMIRRRWWLLAGLAVVPTVVVLGRGAIALYNEVGQVAARSQAFDAMLVSAAETAGDKAIIIAADPALVPEWICAIPSLLGSKGVQNPIYLERVNESGDPVGAQFSGYHARCLGGEAYTTTADLSESAVGAVLLLSSSDGFEAVAPDWYQPDGWQLAEHTQVFETLRFNRSAPPASVTFTSLEAANP